jgi:plastocyanin
MKRFPDYAVTLLVAIGLPLPALTLASEPRPDASPQTYTVLVGLEQPGRGFDVEAYFPRSLTIHVGDTVRWVQNANEIHTVTFADGVLVRDLILRSAQVPGADPAISPLLFNPAAADQTPPSGSDFLGGIGGFANSGIMGLAPGQVREYDLTFVAEGTYGYFCVVHGTAMSGQASSGLLLPGTPEPTYSLVVGDISPGLLPFSCLLHDASGMTGELMVVPRK